MKPYYEDESVTLYHGDALTVLSSLPDASVNCCVTSPPYFGLRDYGVEGQLGLEASPAEYVENLRALFAQVRRVLADDGTLFLNLGDSYSTGKTPSAGGPPYGMSDTVLAGCQGGDCPSTCRCDGHRACAAVPTHIVRSGTQHARGSDPYASDPNPDHRVSHCPCLDGSDSTHPSLTRQSSRAIPDQRRTLGPAHEQPLASRVSTPDESSRQHLAECSRSGSREFAPQEPHSFVCGDPRCGHSWVCICGTPQPSDSSDGRKMDRESLGSAWVDSTTKFLPAKNLLGIPWRVAFALQDDGWILRNDIIWAKPNAMPESVTDRLSTRHEHLFMFAKSPRYWFDLDAVREAHTSDLPNGYSKTYGEWVRTTDNNHNRTGVQGLHINGKNPGDVWNIPTQPFASAHFAVMPRALAERAIQAGCKPGGTVLDPFSGSGTTGLAAARHGRKYVGIDLNAEYLDLSLRTRLAQPGLDFGSAS